MIQMRGKGSLTLPVELRRKYGLNDGDAFSLIDLGEGAFLLTPRVMQVDRLGDRVAAMMADKGVSLDDMLQALEEERERYYVDQYAQD